MRDAENIIFGFQDREMVVPFTREHFLEAREVIKQILQIKESDSNEIDPSKIKFKNERQRKLYEKREAARKKLEESRKAHNKKKGSSLTLGDFIIGIGAMSKLTPEQIDDFSISYLYDYFAALQKREAFHIQVQQAMFAKKAEVAFWLGG